MKPGVALQAKLPAFPTNQQHSIGRAVWTMTDNTSLHFRRGMLVHKRTTLLDVALNTSFCLRLDEAGGV